MTDPTAQPAYWPRVGDRVIVIECEYEGRHNGMRGRVTHVFRDGSCVVREDAVQYIRECIVPIRMEPQRAEEPALPAAEPRFFTRAEVETVAEAIRIEARDWDGEEDWTPIATAALSAIGKVEGAE
jgi:hypothetical protein